MNTFCVKDLMVPISEYATVQVGTTMLDALRELSNAQAAYTESHYLHRGILVLDEHHNVIGKISQLRVLKAVIPESSLRSDIDLDQFGFSSSFIDRMKLKYRLDNKIINNENLNNIASLKVEEFMQIPEPGEFVAEDANLDVAIYQLVSKTHLSLLVTRGEKIVGILRIADVFAALSQEMEKCSRRAAASAV
ncbi:hypothetical protein CSB45_15970 [candidate division KSB3 bacterium]|uniref:CBS domain-containing protein n=1 Tax=candidate division KSB3 bacterium TaxID=2044937 RepID=A0A2G6E110_9BACT|nr:MAG: hypothetical protein CSB45_15970 [candidate division KSB3 bacterium]